MHFQGRQLCQNNFTSLQKSVYSKRKEFAARGSKSFPLIKMVKKKKKKKKKKKHQGCQIISCVDKNSDFPIQSAKLYTDSTRTTHRYT